MRNHAPRFPRRVKVCFYTPRGRLLKSSTTRRLDLFDTVVLWSSQRTITILMGLSTQAVEWKLWTNEAIQRLEEVIRRDFEFDGCTVKLIRKTVVGRGRRPLCSSEFLWKLWLRPRH